MWIEDVESLKAKVSLVKENNLAGVASWQYGMETQDDSEDVEKEMADKAAAEDDEEESIEVVVEKSED